MSAATLSPVEAAEVDRFGIHDLDILAVMEEHADDVPCCEIVGDCTRAAQANVAIRCCGRRWLCCAHHLMLGILDTEMLLARHRHSSRAPMCAGCRHVFANGSTFADLFQVVPL